MSLVPQCSTSIWVARDAVSQERRPDATGCLSARHLHCQDSQTLVDELMAKTKIFFFLAALMIAEAWDVSLCTLSFELEFNGRLKLGVMTSVGQVAN